ncbi:MAG: histidine--tRNA ligase [Candidatus Nealsonbacteria bacterium]|nr:histidine--tRNA ligase [Candidatus Nealsonbacteria bacterium]
MPKRIKFQSPVGMSDILPEDQKYFKKIYETAEKIADFYGFLKIDTPIVEDEEIFDKGTGASTDIVKKEMFSFRTKGGDVLALRPEGTPGIARAYIEHGMHAWPQPIKLWYFGPFFRYEHPQAGRYRQFWQFGFEVLGEAGPVIDVQIIQIFYSILKELKLKDLSVEINSIGDNQCRPYYKKLLANYLKSRESSLCSECRRRIKENVLRVLDCKEEKCQPIKTEAPQILEHLCDECKAHFKTVLEFLDEIEIPYQLNPYLVRGLDYYTKTVFEIASSFEKIEETKDGKKEVEKKRLELGGGGRYDKLLKTLGGRDTPACGGAVGVERVIMFMKKQGIKIEETKEVSVFLSQIGDMAKRKSLKLLEQFRKAKISIGESFGRDSLRAQMNRADKLGARFTLILGQKEALDETVIIRDMQNGKQTTVKLEKAVQAVREMLKK